jgi:hypothetical protein
MALHKFRWTERKRPRVQARRRPAEEAEQASAGDFAPPGAAVRREVRRRATDLRFARSIGVGLGLLLALVFGAAMYFLLRNPAGG